MPGRPPDPRIVQAQIQGTVRRHVKPDPAEDSPRDVALEALAELTAGRPDAPALLAEAAGIMLGAARLPADVGQAERAAELLKAAGADPELIPGWAEEGQRRRERADLPPFGSKVTLGQRRRGSLCRLLLTAASLAAR